MTDYAFVVKVGDHYVAANWASTAFTTRLCEADPIQKHQVAKAVADFLGGEAVPIQIKELTDDA